MYNKLFGKIVDSSIWMEDDHVRLIWMMFIAIMDEDGFVNLAGTKNVAHRAVMDLEKAEDAIRVLESPDPDSSNPGNDGRRLTRFPGGWVVNNSKEYREIVKREHQKELNRERVRKHRKRKESEACNGACNGPVMVANDLVTPSDTDTEAYTNNKKVVSDYSDQFETFWAAYPPKRKRLKRTAYKDWLKAIKRCPPEDIIAAVIEYAKSDVGRGEYVSGPSPWLNGDGWDADRESWRSGVTGATSVPEDYYGTSAGAADERKI